MDGNRAKAMAFSGWLRAQMGQHQMSNRGLGRSVDPEQPERGRRRVLRHLSGRHFPSAASRASYLAVFGLEDDPFSDDDEEADLAVELRNAFRALVRIERKLNGQGRKGVAA